MSGYSELDRIDFTLREGKIGYRRISFERLGSGRFDRWYGPAFAYETHEPHGPLSAEESASLISALEAADPLSWKDRSRRLTCLGGVEWTLSLEFFDGTTCHKLGVNDLPETFEILLEEMIRLGLPMPDDGADT